MKKKVNRGIHSAERIARALGHKIRISCHEAMEILMCHFPVLTEEDLFIRSAGCTSHGFYGTTVSVVSALCPPLLEACRQGGCCWPLPVRREKRTIEWS
jgi:hypothetical protein